MVIFGILFVEFCGILCLKKIQREHCETNFRRGVELMTLNDPDAHNRNLKI